MIPELKEFSKDEGSLGNDLFKNIKPEKQAEWQELYGGEEAKKAKEAEAKKKALKKAEKDKKKAKKAAEKGQVGVETVEKDGAQTEADGKDAVEAVTEVVKQAALQTS